MLLPGLPCSAQEKFVWHNPSTAGFSTVHNQLWKGQEIKSFYDRLPARAEHLVRKVVWALSENAAGLKLIFNTDAKQIIVRYVVAEKRYAMDHFPATGVSGLDLFMEIQMGAGHGPMESIAFRIRLLILTPSCRRIRKNPNQAVAFICTCRYTIPSNGWK